MYYGTSQLVFNFETSTSDLDTVTATATVVTPGGSTTIFEGGSNISLTIRGAALGDAEYLAVSVPKTATTVTQNTALFPATFAQPPVGSTLPATSKTNFTFYANGVNIPNDYVTSFIDDGNNTCTLTINTTGLGYYLTGKEITAIGKFQ
jgi:hypothetical protein